MANRTRREECSPIPIFAKIARALQERIPGAAQVYLAPSSSYAHVASFFGVAKMLPEIATELGFPGFTANPDSVRRITGLALAGNPTSYFGAPTFRGLVDAEQMSVAATSHFVHSNRENARFSKNVAKTEKERRALSREGIEGRGAVPWIILDDLQDGDPRPGEAASAYAMSCSPEYCHQQGSYKGRPNYKLIKDALFKVYPEIGTPRTADGVRNAISRHRKKLEIA